MKKLFLILMFMASVFLNAQSFEDPTTLSKRFVQNDPDICDYNTDVSPLILKLNGEKPVYGYITYGMSDLSMGIAKFDMSTPQSISVIHKSKKIASAGAYAIDKYFVCQYDIIAGYAFPLPLAIIDIETGTQTQIGTDTKMYRDMAYDYSTNTMFAIIANEDKTVSILCSINIQTGECLEIGTTTGKFFFTLACSYDGQLYGIAKDGFLYKLNKSDGTCTLVGNTNVKPNYLQTMEFDHTDGALYWASCNTEGKSYFYKIDPSNGVCTNLGKLGNDAQISGLYIPFKIIPTGAPAAVTSLTAEPGINGDMTAKLKWINPDKTFKGSTLTELTAIEIYRNGVLKFTMPTPEIGQESTWTDTGLTDGFTDYEIVTVNSFGKGDIAETSVYAGIDLPGAVTNLILVKKGENAELTWIAPDKGINNGWFDLSSLKYTITRLPDNVVFENITGTSFNDNSISSTGLQKYYYQVKSINSKGEGGQAVSNKVIIGPAEVVPTYGNFEALDKFDIWTVIDNDNNKTLWSRSKSTKENVWCATIGCSKRMSLDDYFISYPINLESGKTYKLSFDCRANSKNYPAAVDITLGKDATPEAQNVVIKQFDSIKNEILEKRIMPFTVDQSGIYHIGFRCKFDDAMFYIYVGNFIVEEYNEKDLAVIGLSGSPSPVKGIESVYKVTYKNLGYATQNGFSVQLLDQEGNLLAENNITEPLESECSASTSIKWTPQTVGQKQLSAKIILPADVVSENDLSEPIQIDIRPEGSPEWVEMGEKATLDKKQPFYFFYKSSAAQTIYYPSEVGAPGNIEEIYYYYDNQSGKDINNKPIKLRFTNTDRMSIDAQWFTQDELTTVFEGNVSLVQGKGLLKIKLDSPFLYNGDNLCIMTERLLDTDAFNNVMFYFTADNTSSKRSQIYYHDKNAFEWASGQYGLRMDNISDAILIIKRSNGGKLTGKITEDNQPVKDAKIEIEGVSLTIFSGDDGSYSFNWLPSGTYNMKITKHGYVDVTKSDIIISNGNTTISDIEIGKLVHRSVKGKVTDRETNVIAGAKISITGYNGYQTTTLDDGTFSLPAVYIANNYEIKISNALFSTWTGNFNVEDADVDLGTIELYDKLLPVANIISSINNEKVNLTWSKTIKESEFRNDDGVVSGQLGLANGSEKSIFGSVYRTPAVLYGMSWYTTDNGGPHNNVNIFVFSLNSEGMPTSEILYSEKNVPNKDSQWNKISFPQIVNAPNGFMLAISYKGFLAIGMDSGKSTEFPFKLNTNYFTDDYTSDNFKLLEENNYKQNLLIRAEGALTENMTDEDTRAINGYNVWRLNDGMESIPDSWELLTDEIINQQSFVDDSWSRLQYGAYRYAVKVVYSDNKISIPNFSNITPKDMSVKVTVKVNTNTSKNESQGAKVILTCDDNNLLHIYESLADENGNAVFNDIWRGNYNIDITLEGFSDYSEKNLNLESNTVLEIGPYTLEEIIPDPFGLEIVKTDTLGSRIFYWNIIDNITEDFERMEDFSINNPGQIGWQYIDADAAPTYSIQSINFPNSGSKMAYMIFNPSQTTPAMTLEAIKPHGGQKFLADFTIGEQANDDWFISPLLNFSSDFTFSFYAKSYVSSYELEQIQIGYSLTGTDPDDFKWFTKSAIKVPADKWAYYNYTVPKDSKFVTIRSISKKAFILMIDDVFIGKTKSRSFINYEVYLDGKKVSETSSDSLTFEKLSKGKHTAAVKATHTSGSSKLKSIEFDVEEDVGIIINEDQLFNIYPIPAKNNINIEFTGIDIEKIELYDNVGKCIKSFDECTNTKDMINLNISDIANGVYFLKIFYGNTIKTCRIIINR